MFSEVIGQEQALSILQQAVAQNKVAPAYLFVGMPGIGKTLTARNFAGSLLATESTFAHPDLLWVEPTYSDRGNLITVSQAQAQALNKKGKPKIRIEQIRDLSQFLRRLPLKSDRLVIVVEEAQLMAEAAANALLKTLEEPGNGVIILLADAIELLLPTIVSRCQIIRFIPLSTVKLQQVLVREDYPEIIHNPSLLAMAQGSPGKAISAWQQLQTLDPELLHKLQQPTTDTLTILMLAKQIVQELEPTTQLWLIDYLQYCHWQQTSNIASSIAKAKAWEEAKKYLASYVQPRLVWENLLLTTYLEQYQ